MKDESFATVGRFFWLWATAAAVTALGVLYVLDEPIGGRNGGTLLGYAYGGLAAAGIVFLMWYGVRRRYSYGAQRGTLRGWLSAHVWIGVGLAFVVPLHAGFHVGRNVHTAAYLLMLATIASGIWGALAYVRLPPRLLARRDGLTLASLGAQADQRARRMQAIREGRAASFAAFARALDAPLPRGLLGLLRGRPIAWPSRAVIAARLHALPEREHEAAFEYVALAHERVLLRNRILDEASVAARLRAWLWLHVPLSFACVVAVAAHVFWVLCYRWSAR